MNEAEVRSTPEGARAQLAAADLTPRLTAYLSAVLLLAAGCSMAGDPPRKLPWQFGVANGGGIAPPPPAASSGGAGTGVPGTGGSPVGAGTGQPITTAGVGTGIAGRGNPPPIAGSPVTPGAGTGGIAPMADSGLPDFNAGTDPARNRVQAGQICARVSAIQCAAEVHCCTKPAKSLEACTSQLTKSCTDNLFLDTIAKNEVSGYSSTHTEAVLNQLEEYSKACDPAVIQWAGKADGLLSMFQGTVAPGGTCKPTGIILGPSNFYTAVASCQQAATTGCMMTGNGAPPTAPQTATCAPRVDAGGACFTHVNCKDGLYCPNTRNSYAGGKCTPQKATAMACTDDAECATLTCRSGVCLVATVQTAYCVST